MYNKIFVIVVALCTIVFACQTQESKKKENAGKVYSTETRAGETVNLPAPYATKSVQNYCDVIGWPANKTPCLRLPVLLLQNLQVV